MPPSLAALYMGPNADPSPIYRLFWNLRCGLARCRSIKILLGFASTSESPVSRPLASSAVGAFGRPSVPRHEAVGWAARHGVVVSRFTHHAAPRTSRVEPRTRKTPLVFSSYRGLVMAKYLAERLWRQANGRPSETSSPAAVLSPPWSAQR